MRKRYRQPRHDPIWGILDYQGRSIVWLAQRTGYSEVMVRHVKIGIAAPSRQFRERCSTALDLPENVLFFGGECPLDRTNEPEAANA